MSSEKRAISVRQVQKIVKAGRRITREDADTLRTAPRTITLKDIEDLGKIAEPAERASVVLRLSAGNAKSAADARRSLRVEQGLEAPAKTPVEQQYLSLKSAWVRASKAALDRFLEDHLDDVEAALAARRIMGGAAE